MMEVLNDEETQFRRTLNRGRRLFVQAADKATDGVLDGATVWRLWDTYGFPNDLTRTLLALRGSSRAPLLSCVALPPARRRLAKALASHLRRSRARPWSADEAWEPDPCCSRSPLPLAQASWPRSAA